jgi:hypothetical protein
VSVVPSADSGWMWMIAVVPAQQLPSAFHSRYSWPSSEYVDASMAPPRSCVLRAPSGQTSG